MKKDLLIMLLLGAAAMTSCNNQKHRAETDGADSTQVLDATDTLNSAEAVIKQVHTVYDFWNWQREHFDENNPHNPQVLAMDERFGSKEWLQVREKAWEIDRDCECGGFFDFGEEGPLDPWVYDCYEGPVSADSIEAKILPNGMAEVTFQIKDSVTIKGIPMRWLMRVEDGEWRVANIFFEKDGGIDLLESLRAYGQ